MLYINPYRHKQDGKPFYQKSKPHLKSAFADRRKTRVHSRGEFRAREVLAHIGNVWIIHEAGDFGYSVSCESEGCPWGAMSIVQANAIAANYRNQDVMNWGACDNVVIGANAFCSAELPTGLEVRA